MKFSGQKMSNGGDLQPPIHLENRFKALMNVGEESPNVTKHGSNQPAANIATNKRLRSSRQRHSAQSAAEHRTLIVGDSIIRNISSRTTTTCCFPQATVSDVNKELQNILMKHKTANRIIIHVGKNDIRKEQSELLKKDFTELSETLQRLEIQSFYQWTTSSKGNKHVFTATWAEYMATKILRYKRSQLHRQLQYFLGPKTTV